MISQQIDKGTVNRIETLLIRRNIYYMIFIISHQEDIKLAISNK